MRRNNARQGERGLTLLEALIVVTATAMLALLLLPLVARTAERNFGVAYRSIDSAAAASAEVQTRMLFAAVTQHPEAEIILDGQAESVTFAPSLVAPIACAPAGARTWIRLRIVNGADGDGQLVCETDERRVQVLSWPAGSTARFAFSESGETWSSAWREPTPAPGSDLQVARSALLVRFSITARDSHDTIWIMRAGANEPITLVEGAS